MPSSSQRGNASERRAVRHDRSASRHAQSADRLDVPVLVHARGGPAERLAALVRSASPGGRLRRRDARRPGRDRRALDRPGLPRHPGGGARLGHRRGRRTRQRVARRAPDVVPDGCLADRLDRRRRSRAADRRRIDRARLRRPAEVADRRVRRVRAGGRVGDLPRDDARRPLASASRRSSREPAGQRQLPVRSHRRVDRGLRRPRAAAHVQVHEPRLPGVRLGVRRGDGHVRRDLAHVSRHAPSARRRGRRRWSASPR